MSGRRIPHDVQTVGSSRLCLQVRLAEAITIEVMWRYPIEVNRKSCNHERHEQGNQWPPRGLKSLNLQEYPPHEQKPDEDDEEHQKPHHQPN